MNKTHIYSFYVFLIIYTLVLITIFSKFYHFKLKKTIQNSIVDEDENRFYITDIFQVKNRTMVQKLPKVLIIGEAKCGTGNTDFIKMRKPSIFSAIVLFKKEL